MLPQSGHQLRSVPTGPHAQPFQRRGQICQDHHRHRRIHMRLGGIEDIVVRLCCGPEEKHIVPVRVPQLHQPMPSHADPVAQKQKCIAHVLKPRSLPCVLRRIVRDPLAENGFVARHAQIFVEQQKEIELLVAGQSGPMRAPAEAEIVQLDLAIGQRALHDEAQSRSRQRGIGVAERQSLLGQIAAAGHHAPPVVIHHALRNHGLVVVFTPGCHLLQHRGVPPHLPPQLAVRLILEAGNNAAPFLLELRRGVSHGRRHPGRNRINLRLRECIAHDEVEGHLLARRELAFRPDAQPVRSSRVFLHGERLLNRAVPGNQLDEERGRSAFKPRHPASARKQQ